MAKVKDPPLSETFERLCLTLDMARGLDDDDAYALIRDAAQTLPKRSPIATWFLREALSILGHDYVPYDYVS